MMDDLNLEIFDLTSKIVVKCRLFIPFDDCCHLFKNATASQYEDRFYDKIGKDEDCNMTAKYGADGTYYRRRVNMKTGIVEEQVEQKTKPITSSCHIYEQIVVGNDTWQFSENDCFLCYSFERFSDLKLVGKIDDDEETNDIKCVLDRVTSNNVNYCVISLSCCFSKSNDWDDVRVSAQKKMLFFIKKYDLSRDPVFTKFMFMLQLSENYELYEDVFKASCTILDASIEQLVYRFLNQEGQSRYHKEYIWIVCHVQGLFAQCIELGMSVEKTMQHINEKKNMMMRNVDVFFRQTYSF